MDGWMDGWMNIWTARHMEWMLSSGAAWSLGRLITGPKVGSIAQAVYLVVFIVDNMVSAQVISA